MADAPPEATAAAAVAAVVPMLDGARRVAIIARPRQAAAAAELVAGLAKRSPESRCVRLDGRLSQRDLHVRLAALGPVDAVVDLMRERADERADALGPLVARYLTRGPVGGRGEWVARSTDRPLLPVVRDRDVAAVLDTDPSRGRILAARPGAEWRARGEIRTSARMPRNDLPSVLSAPELTVREWSDVVALPRQVAISRGLVLPESFSTADDKRLVNPFLDRPSSRAAVRPEAASGDLPVLPGAFYHLENVMPRHFGHALTEVVSRLWGWSVAREHRPGLKALLFDPEGRLATWQYDLLAAGGVEPADVHVATGPVRVEALVGASPQFSRPAYIHPDMAEVMDRVGAALEARAVAFAPRDRPGKVFLTRRPLKRVCRNAEEVHARFEAAGWSVLLPEELPLPQQAAVVRGADAVAGFAGSQMFHIGYTAAPTRVALMTSENYPAVNETLMSSLRGHRLDIAVCPADVPRPPNRFAVEAFHSDFEVGPEQWEFLEEALSW